MVVSAHGSQKGYILIFTGKKNNKSEFVKNVISDSIHSLRDLGSVL